MKDDSSHNVFHDTQIDTKFVQTRFAQYKICDTLGQGGVGKVYKALDANLNREVALKVLLDNSPLEDTPARQRFHKEAVSMAKISHENIAQIYEAGVFEGIAFLTMELIEGGDLKEYKRRKKLSFEQIADITAQIAKGVEHAHQNKVIHRDLKPSNILMDGDKPKITDFGLAQTHNVPNNISLSGSILGTLNYMPPEQTRGENVDQRADTYAIGAILYELLTNRPPFRSPNAVNLVFKITRQEVTFPAQAKKNIPKKLQNICFKALEKKPEDRYQSAADLASDLYSFINKETQRSKIQNFPHWARIKRKYAKYALFVSIAIMCVVLFLNLSKTNTTNTANTTNTTKTHNEKQILAKLRQQKLDHLSQLYQYKGHYYAVIASKTSWLKAYLTCKKLGGYLVTVTDHDENQFLMSIMSTRKKYWIGLQYKNKKNSWVTQEPLLYKNWSIVGKHLPGSKPSVAVYTKVQLDNSCDWQYDKSGRQQLEFVCEWGKNRQGAAGKGRDIIAKFKVKQRHCEATNMQYPKNVRIYLKAFVIKVPKRKLRFSFQIKNVAKEPRKTLLLIRNFSGTVNKNNRTYININLNGRSLRRKHVIVYQNPEADYIDVSDYVKQGLNNLSIELDPSSGTVYFLNELTFYTTTLRKKYETE
ncbi:protein kinase domain-containing protein [Candidatus Uabimicrobium amorphum]|uniref:non-specific serine/threonine protein kinase n=1 Tax=Uabimicrobium amorphum TaxID=2596890 RepID=A0A5S9IK67_UABAM|nr:protein kinase [Candidatus Uabimicrobium amorphum]BBM82560.1 protein kinase [Candidatus Uabimicrobium amorphum]